MKLQAVAAGIPWPSASPFTSSAKRPCMVAASTSSKAAAFPMLRDDHPPPPTSVAIKERWREYQGDNNWEGLLDPLDSGLRSEILRYGEFARAAYTCFDFDPSSPTYATCRFPKGSFLPCAGLPDTGYRVTRHLTATSGNAPWLPFSPRTAWIGYVAVCDDADEIDRLGRRDIVVAFRGTATVLEWAENLRATLTHLGPVAPRAAEPMVESGFWSLFTSGHRSLRDQVRCEVRRLLDKYSRGPAPPVSLTITGHSLGAALAVLTAYDVTTALEDEGPSTTTVVSFGGPRVGNASFRRGLEEAGTKVLRIVNTDDIIPKVPPAGFVAEKEQGAAEAVETEEEESGAGWRLPNWLASKTGWAYADLGRELRLSSGRRTGNVVACHDLGLYLNLVDQLSSGGAGGCPLCPSLANAIRTN
ncbi:phospholipase A(1) DAD1, chloroplastic-like [Zingiber officinale]|uniref:Fungal lipase-type domain-containing protein n=1 Tax=Zingiber officinale TaxID=94328 RepID=A0A8J5EEU2_ZINOF|nr:phospholipase A(1) DAD1, chloroplastic-like [Zingiber officinale]KAG6474769.1 hypothetical protein ZIOFF_068708 [Zingiber officinale]